MIKRIIAVILFPCMLIALALALVGVKQVEFGDSYYQFLVNVNSRLSTWEFTIPDIPPITGSISTSSGIIDFIVNSARDFINFFIGIFNFVIMVVNTIIHLIQFIFTFIYSCKDFITSVSGVRFLSV